MVDQLPPLQIGSPIGYVKGDKVYIDTVFQRFIQTLLKVLASRLTAVELAVLQAQLEASIAVVETATEAAQTAADNANTAATVAQTATEDNARFLAISNSNVTGCTITATDAGASATIAISSHTRNYADGTSVAVTGTGGSPLTGLAYSTQYFIYYDQSSLAGGAVTYATTTNGPDAQPTAAGGSAPDRHYVGSAVTPAAAGGPVLGAGAVAVNFDRPIGGDWL